MPTQGTRGGQKDAGCRDEMTSDTRDDKLSDGGARSTGPCPVNITELSTYIAEQMTGKRFLFAALVEFQLRWKPIFGKYRSFPYLYWV